MKLKTLKVFDTAIEAHIFKNTLEGEGIEAHIFDENIVTLNPLLNFAVGGIRLQVHEKDYEKALSLINELARKPLVDDEGKTIQCPKCASQELYSDFKTIKDPKGFFAFLLGLLLSAFPIYSKSVYKCKQCDTEFEKVQ
jgi:DNA-directed RNA polymerase subunit RPC12/RpoP